MSSISRPLHLEYSKQHVQARPLSHHAIAGILHQAILEDETHPQRAFPHPLLLSTIA